MVTWVADASYLAAAVLFIFGVKKLSMVRTARQGNTFASLGMLLAIVMTLLLKGVMNYQLIAIAIIIGSVIGAFMARTVKMTAMPQLVAIFNGFGGIASALVAASELNSKEFSPIHITLGTQLSHWPHSLPRFNVRAVSASTEERIRLPQ